MNATIVKSSLINLVKFSTFNDPIIATETNNKVTVIQEIEANDKLKFLNTFLKPSLIFLNNILLFLILIVSSFRIIFFNSSLI